MGRSLATVAATRHGNRRHARAEIGGRLQNLDVIKTRLEDENVQLRTALSQDIDVDLGMRRRQFDHGFPACVG